VCSGGSYTSADRCYRIRTEIETVVQSDDMNIIVEFTQDVTILGELNANDFTFTTYYVKRNYGSQASNSSKIILDTSSVYG
jgi:hypothetical protein